jgi:hypothetical protein
MSRTLRSLAPQDAAAAAAAAAIPGPAPPPAVSARPAALVCEGPGCAGPVKGGTSPQTRTSTPDVEPGDSDSWSDSEAADRAQGDGGGAGDDEDVCWSSGSGDESEDDHEAGPDEVEAEGGAGERAEAAAGPGPVRFEVPEALGAEPVDREHRACARRLNALARRRDAPALARAIAALAAHFAHEERLLLAGGGGGARAAAAHAADHAAILALARSELRRCRGSAGGPGRAVRRDFLTGLADRFAFHTREYDARCAAALGAGAAAEPARNPPQGSDASAGGAV